MNSIDDIAIVTLLLGGFAFSFFLTCMAFFPRWKILPKRWALIIAGFLPTITLICMWFGDFLVQGRDLDVFLALSPMIFSIIMPVISAWFCILVKKGWCLTYCILLELTIIWSLTILWMMTDSGFMGASC
jgi:hypothetical protein